MDVAAGPRVHGPRVELAGQPLGVRRRVEVAPAEDRGQRLAAPVDGDEAVAEARRADGVHLARAAGSANRPPHDPDELLGIGLAEIVVPRRLPAFRRGRTEHVRAYRRRPYVDGENPHSAGRAIVVRLGSVHA